VNDYEVEALAWCHLQVKLCDPCLSVFGASHDKGAIYKSTLTFTISFDFMPWQLVPDRSTDR